jgi:hypothetical protein
VIESFNPDKSHLDIKSQITIINKLAKDELYREANQTVLKPLWECLARHFCEYKNLMRLQKEQIGLLIWSFGHSDIDVVKANQRLWNSIEMFILNKVGLKKFNGFTISQITYGLSKSGQGSKEFWNAISENYINQSQ